MTYDPIEHEAYAARNKEIADKSAELMTKAMQDPGQFDFKANSSDHKAYGKKQVKVIITGAKPLKRIKPDWSLYEHGEPKSTWGKSRG